MSATKKLKSCHKIDIKLPYFPINIYPKENGKRICIKPCPAGKTMEQACGPQQWGDNAGGVEKRSL